MKNLIFALLLIAGVMIVVQLSDGGSWNDDSSTVHAANKDFQKNFTVTPGQQLDLVTDVGSVNIEGTSDNKVVISAQIRGSDDAVNEFEISAEQNSAGIVIRGEKKSKGWSKIWNHFDVTYTVKLPKQFNMKVSTAGGNIKVTGLNGTMNGRTSGGNILLTDVDGTMEFRTSGGNISVDRSKGALQAKTSGGNIKIESADGDVDVSTSGGNISATDIKGKLEAETSGGHVKAKLTGPNKGITLRTSGGDIAVWAPKDIKAALDATTSGGEVTCELPVTVIGKIKSTKIQGDINGGGPAITLRTSGGDIDIRKNE